MARTTQNDIGFVKRKCLNFYHPSVKNVLGFDSSTSSTFGRATVAIDAKTCRERWTYIWQLKGQIMSPANRGAAIKDGRLVRGTADGYLIAVNMAMGRFCGASRLQARPVANISHAADDRRRSHDSRTFGADLAQRTGSARSSSRAASRYGTSISFPIPASPAPIPGQSAESLKHGGGSVWTPLSLDAKAGIVFCRSATRRRISTARSGPAPISIPTRSSRSTPRRQAAVVSPVHPARRARLPISARSARYSSTTINGKTHDVITVSGKDGLLRLLDRDSREQVYEVPITTRENVDAVPTVEGVHLCPGLLGGMEWNGPATIPAATGLFVPAVDWCGIFSKAPKDPPIMQGMHYYGGLGRLRPA